MNRQSIQKRKPLRLAVGIALLALVVVLVARARAGTRRQTGNETLMASGVIQAQEVAIASEFAGQIAEMPVAEGDDVTAGQVVVQLDTELLDARVEVARATVEMAEAGLAQAKAGARAGQVAVAEAQLAQAEAGRLTAQQAVSDTQALLANPQDINLQIAVAKAQLESARHQQAQAVARKDAVELAKRQVDDAYAQFNGGGRQKFLVSSGSISDLLPNLPPEIRDRLPDLSKLVDGVYTFGDFELHIHGGTYDLYKWVTINFPLDALLLPNTWWQAWVGVNAATAKEEGTEAALSQLYAQRNDPQTMQTKVDEALSMRAQMEAQVAMAQAQVHGLEAGATAEQIAAIEARVAQARAGLNSLLEQRGMLTLTAPQDGTVVDITAHPGEVIAAGAPLLTIADLSALTLNVYAPEDRLGEVHLDQQVQMTVNSFPGRVFEGRVSRIADRAEFTPRNVSTQEERVNLVFAVEIRITNQDGALKPGMAADVVFTAGD